MDFEVLDEPTDVETIAKGRAVANCHDFGSCMAKGARKMKGLTRIRLKDGRVRWAELHWYEAHGIGKKEFKRKRYID
jgi:hypothetical protein